MIDPNKLMRSVILALAVLLAAPVAGAALPILGVGQAEAATVSRIVVSGNHQVDADTVDSIIPLKVGQPAVAKLERRTDMYVSNLRRYIEALGGSLEITARFPEGSVNIVNFGELDDARTRKSS